MIPKLKFFVAILGQSEFDGKQKEGYPMDRNHFVQLFSFCNGIFSGAILSFRESIMVGILSE